MIDSVEFFVGARGTGKSTLMKQRARGFGRVFAFSPYEKTNRYGDFLGVDPSPTLDHFLYTAAALGRAVWAPPRRANPELFDQWCKNVWHLKDGLCLVDELAMVSKAGKAAGWWGDIVLFGRHQGLCVAAGAQRPTEVDSTIRGNNTRTFVFRLGKLSDRELMADEIGVDIERVTALQDLQFLEYDSRTGGVTPGKIVFRQPLRTYT